MRVFSIATITLMTASATVFGHGAQIQITHDAATGKIQTRDVLSSSGGAPNYLSDLKRVYVMPLLPFSGPAGDGWYSRPVGEINPVTMLPHHPTGPGLMFQYDDQIAGSGWSFSGSGTMPNLENSNFAYEFGNGLLEWNGGGFVDPGDEQLQMFAGGGTSVPSATALTTDAGPFDGVAFSNISSLSGNPHSSAGFLLYGDGASSALSGPAAGDDGIYLAQLTVTSTAAGVSNSDPIYFVLHKNASATAALDAAQSLGFDPSLITVVPEPTAAALLLIGGSMLIRRRARNH